MYLKEVEINGFKSFANKIQLSFDQGITAIVGPNGSGKSNVVDAIRWVLGEQKIKQLRGEKMEDVIFAGTEHRKSQGYAYVSMTIDNRDHSLPVEFDEVKVSRKLYRSGESEYRMNDHICRLKDIHEIFYDTGIGKEGYSIIGQGEIDKILSGKPDRRRELIDEAIGIVKFKKRKAEAIKKLEGEEVNLLRILDITGEMQHQLRPLEEQAKKAREYLSCKESLRGYEIFEFVKNYEAARAELDDLEEKINDRAEELEDLKRRQTAGKAANESLEERNDLLESQIASVNERIKETLSEMSEIGSNEKLLAQEIEFLESRIERLKADEANLRQEWSEAKRAEEEESRKLSALHEEAVALEHETKPLRDEYERLEKEHRTAEETLRMVQEDGQKHVQARLDLNQKLTRHRMTTEQLEEKKRVLQQESETADKAYRELEERRKESAVRVKEMSLHESELTRDKDRLRDEVGTLSKTVKERRERIIEGEKTLSREASRLNVLENMATRYEGYGQAVKRVMEAFPVDEDNRGVVADLVHVDERYEVAIETALGATLQNIVTETTSRAKKMIEALRKNRWGRVTFLPLDNLKVRGNLKNDPVLKMPGIVDVAVNLVRLPDGFRRLGDYLLGNTLVCKDMDAAIAINRKTKGYRIVTMQGELLMPTGALTGGSFRNNSNLLSRSREIEELKERMEGKQRLLDEERSRLNEEIALQQELQDRLNKVYDEREILRLDMAKENEVLANRERELKERLERLDRLKEEAGELEAGRNASDEALRTCEEELERLAKEQTRSKERQESLQTETEGNRQRLAELVEALAELQNRKVASDQQLSFSEETFERLGREREQLEIRVMQVIREMEETSEELTGKRSHVVDSTEDYERLKEIHARALTEVRRLEEEHRELKEKNRKIFEEREKIADEVLNLQTEKIRLENQHENKERKFTDKVDYMWDEYHLTYSEARNVETPDYGKVAVSKEIDALKRKIRTMGSINVNAVEEHRELRERFEFLDRQRRDIEEAKAKLTDVIRSLDEGMVSQFQEKFTVLEAEFKKIFVELFGGGKVSMELTEPEDVLESGININAQPPGKKLQNMLQLSGGEKALTAISLMFAIQNLNPSPFCFLDEIEAALDDNNVYRFANYLSNLTGKTQFIVITHRKGTMESADRLYGVTMQEKGVSTLVSVELV